jgi:hypothetical protein
MTRIWARIGRGRRRIGICSSAHFSAVCMVGDYSSFFNTLVTLPRACVYFDSRAEVPVPTPILFSCARLAFADNICILVRSTIPPPHVLSQILLYGSYRFPLEQRENRDQHGFKHPRFSTSTTGAQHAWLAEILLHQPASLGHSRREAAARSDEYWSRERNRYIGNVHTIQLVSPRCLGQRFAPRL